MFKRFHYGDRLLIQLTNKEVLSGDCKKSTTNRLDLKNLCDQDGRKMQGFMSFYPNEVVSVRLLTKNDSQGSELTASKLQQTTDDAKLLISEEEYERLKVMTCEHIFIHQKDKRYYDAYDDLLSVESVGVVGLGCKSGRNSRLSLLVFSTWRNIYIFDVSACQGRSLFKELKEILESKYVLKVVHDGRALVDCLFHVHKVHLNNIFDTFIADVMIKKAVNGKYEDKIRSISDCLVEYLNFPEYLLQGALEVTDSEWKQKPLEDEYKLKAAKLATYLLTLKDFLQSKLLEGYFNNVRSVYQMCTSIDSFCFNQLQETEFTSEMDKLIPALNAKLST